MTTTYDTQDAVCTFVCDAVPPGTFLVARWQGAESVSRPYRFVVTLACAERSLALEGLAGSRATLAVRHGEDMLPWHGVITQVQQTGMLGEYAAYDVVLEPRLALLRDFRRSDVFLDRTLADIVRELLADAGLEREGAPGQTDCDFILCTEPGAPLPFVCQFEESVLDFVSRWLEHEGIYYWFEQHAHNECVVFGNARAQQPTQAVPLAWRPEEERTPEREDAAVSAFQCTVHTSPGSVVLRDFAGSRADLDLTVGTVVPAGGEHGSVGQTSIYGEHYDTQAEGQRLAAMRAQEAATWRKRFDGTSVSTALRAGYLASLSGHFRPDYDTDYYVVRIEHVGSQPLPGEALEPGALADTYHNRFTALPAGIQFRAPRLTRWPRVIGMTTAIIDAEGSGEYAEINENGCYKVRFPFASRRAAPAHNSAWVRKATPYAGADHGMHLPLLKGTEVLISFLGGNPDRPVIAGAVSNSEHPNRLNTQHASQPGLRTAGGNALAFEDRTGQQSVVLASPVHQSHLALGATDADDRQHGVRLLSQNHMKLMSGSYEQNVPGIYRHRVIAGASSAQDYLGGTATAHDATSAPPGATGTPLSASQSTSTAPAPTPPAHNVNTTWWDGYGSVTGKQGVTVTEFAGEAATLYAGSWTMVAAGLRTDLTMGVFLMLRAAQTTTLSVGNRLDYQLVGLQKKSITENHTAATYTGAYASKTNNVVAQTDNLGTYDLNVGTAMMITAGASVAAAAPDIALAAGGMLALSAGAQARLASTVVELVGATRVNLEAPSVMIGSPITLALAVDAANIGIGRPGGLQRVAVQGALVSIEPSGLVRIG